jgi:hypothetical protein
MKRREKRRRLPPPKKNKEQKKKRKKEPFFRKEMAAPGEFELARRVAVRMMETRAFAKDIEEEDETMVKYIPNLRRLNELGMITFDSQSGKLSTFPHYQTGSESK